MIEKAPEEYWQQLSFNESVLYCFSLNIDGKIGWRLPTQVEYIYRLLPYDHITNAWYQSDDDDSFEITDTSTCIPVRDLKDD